VGSWYNKLDTFRLTWIQAKEKFIGKNESQPPPSPPRHFIALGSIEAHMEERR